MTPRPAYALAPIVALALLAACTPTDSERAARNESPQASGNPPVTADTYPPPANAAHPDLAVTQEAANLQTNADSLATPEGRSQGSTKGPAATDTSGRAAQERETDR
jgi:hypothetical protein